MRILLVTLMFSTLISGCSVQWKRISADAKDLSVAKGVCTEKANKNFPVKNKVAQKTVYKSEYIKVCDKHCDGDKYKWVDKPEIKSYVMDVNQDSRRHDFYQCMRKAGWKKETKWF